MKLLFSSIIITIFLISSCIESTQKRYQTNLESHNHSFSNFEEVTPTHLYLNLIADFDKKVLKGFAEWDIVPKVGAKKIILDIKDLVIIKTEVDGDIIDFSLSGENEILGSGLIIPITDKTQKVKVFYETSTNAEAIQWLTAEQTGGKPFVYTQSEAILARSWIPCMDIPALRFTYNAIIKCPKDLLPLMSATNPQQKNNESVYHFEMSKPIPSYLMALSIGDLVFAPLGEKCGVYAQPSLIEDCKIEFVDLDRMIKTAESIYGQYRWGRYDILVLPASFPFGGMENPRLTFATPTIITGDKSLVSLIAHELAHSWSGNLVTNRTWDDFWLNEGFTVYFESRIMEKLYGKDFVEMTDKLALDELKNTISEMMLTQPNDTRLFLDLKGRNPDDGMTDIAYEKGHFFLLAIEKQVGRERFDIFLNQYFNHFAFQSINTQTFINYLEENLLIQYPGSADSIGVNEWIFEQGLPINCPTIHSAYLYSVDSLIQDLIAGTKLEKSMFNHWTTHQYLYFFRNLPRTYYLSHMDDLDFIGNFSNSKNAEIACDWFKLCIRSNYLKASPSLENFLIKVGRRKFLEPIYKELLSNPEWNNFAKQVYSNAKKGYHSVSNSTIQEIMKAKFGTNY